MPINKLPPGCQDARKISISAASRGVSTRPEPLVNTQLRLTARQGYERLCKHTSTRRPKASESVRNGVDSEMVSHLDAIRHVVREEAEFGVVWRCHLEVVRLVLQLRHLQPHQLKPMAFPLHQAHESIHSPEHGADESIHSPKHGAEGTSK